VPRALWSLPLLLLADSLAGCASSPKVDAPAARDDRMVLVVSIDALRRDYLDDREHALPTLRRLMNEGAVARSLTSVWPSSTYPAHTTMLTGVPPAKHGIVNNVVFDPYGKNDSGWYWYASDIRVPTLWDAARAQGVDTANVTWPVSVGAPIRWSFPQVWRAKTDEDDKLLAALSTPALCDEIRARKKPLPADHRSDRARTDAALVALEHSPRLAFVYLTDLDTSQHDHGPRSPEAWKTLETADVLLGELVAAAARKTTHLSVVVVSDHGFAPVDTDVRPNVALRRAGLVDVGATGKEKDKVVRYDAVAWRSGGTAAIIGDARHHDRVRALFDELARDPANRIAAVLEGADVERRGGFPGALVVLQAADGATFDESALDPLVGPSKYKGAHGYSPDKPEMKASLVLWGDRVPRGTNLGDVQMIDIAPTIARLAGLSLPTAEGRALVP
jgi:predicted AlkP superfamily pyrophosphatase or phosphodiesterase